MNKRKIQKFQLIAQLIGGILMCIVGIMIIAFLGESGLGAIVLVGGIVFFVLTFWQKKKHDEGDEYLKEQDVFVQNIESVAEISNPITVIVKINNSLKNGKFSIFLNGVRVGDIRFGEELQFHTQKATNLVKVGKLGGKPFHWAESGYIFDATQIERAINLEITHKNLLIMIKPASSNL